MKKYLYFILLIFLLLGCNEKYEETLGLIPSLEESGTSHTGSNAGNNSQNGNGMEFIDLGLPSGLRWASCNLGATKPQATGGYYAWGETETKQIYNQDNYSFPLKTANMTKELESYGNGNVKLKNEYDAAYAQSNGYCRMPTIEDYAELHGFCKKVWVNNFESSNINGYLFTGPNEKSIFFPATGKSTDGKILDYSFFGYYRTSTMAMVGYLPTYVVYDYRDKISSNTEGGWQGCCIRPVKDK